MPALLRHSSSSACTLCAAWLGSTAAELSARQAKLHAQPPDGHITHPNNESALCIYLTMSCGALASQWLDNLEHSQVNHEYLGIWPEGLR